MQRIIYLILVLTTTLISCRPDDEGQVFKVESAPVSQPKQIQTSPGFGVADAFGTDAAKALNKTTGTLPLKDLINSYVEMTNYASYYSEEARSEVKRTIAQRIQHECMINIALQQRYTVPHSYNSSSINNHFFKRGGKALSNDQFAALEKAANPIVKELSDEKILEIYSRNNGVEELRTKIKAFAEKFAEEKDPLTPKNTSGRKLSST